MAAFVEPLLVEDLPVDLGKTHRILDDMIIKGSLIACQRKAELEQLNDMLETLKARGSGMLHKTKFRDNRLVDDAMPVDYLQGAVNSPMVQLVGDNLGPVLQPFEEWTWEDALSSEQLRTVADLLDGDEYIGSSDFIF